MPSRRAWPRIGLKIFRLVDFIQVLPIRYWGERSKWSKSQYCQTKTNFISRLALSPVITKRGWSKRFLEWSESLKRRNLATSNLERSERLRRSDLYTNYFERSERLRRARLVNPCPRAKYKLIKQTPQAKREAHKERLVHQGTNPSFSALLCR